MIIVRKDGVESARLTDDMELVTSRDPDFTILWNRTVEDGIQMAAPPPLQKGDVQELGDVLRTIKPSADTFHTMERMLFLEGYALEVRP